jgi:hypothetical protein
MSHGVAPKNSMVNWAAGPDVRGVRHNGDVVRVPDEDRVVAALRSAGARFAFVHGSRAYGQGVRDDSDLDVAGWWGSDAPPQAWEVGVPDGVDLVVLDRAPLWLAGRIALGGRLLFDDDPPVRVRWQSDTRRIWLDERPYVLERMREWRRAVLAHGR